MKIKLKAVLSTALYGLVIFAPLTNAQETQSEESAKRAQVLENLPDNAAKKLFGSSRKPASLEARAIGSYAKGCLAGARALPVDGETWQVMRLSRNRNWGHPDLISVLERLAKKVPQISDWGGILVGDISQPRGGPMLTGHASHQVGLDADIWLTPMPDKRLSSNERENMSATNMVNKEWMDVDKTVFSENQANIIKSAAGEPNVSRIFVNPAIKVALCRGAGNDRVWLSKVRPMWGHNYHFHIRMNCPAGNEICEDQASPKDDDGCGTELNDWLAKQHKAMFAPKRPAGKPSKPKPPMTLDALPQECRDVLVAK
jgi:penicillin-insensitive murein DD-endopeptidase